MVCLSGTGSSCHVTVMGVTHRTCKQKSWLKCACFLFKLHVTLQYIVVSALKKTSKVNTILKVVIFKHSVILFRCSIWFGRWPEPWNFKTSHFRILYSFPSGTILWNSLPPNLKLIQDIDLFKKKYTDYLMSKQNNEWLYSLYQGFILDYTQIVIFRREYVCIVWNCICCIWLLFWGSQGRLAYCC